jgi:hypothetical protein
MLRTIGAAIGLVIVVTFFAAVASHFSHTDTPAAVVAAAR